jgi:hypothetical protein
MRAVTGVVWWWWWWCRQHLVWQHAPQRRPAAGCCMCAPHTGCSTAAASPVGAALWERSVVHACRHARVGCHTRQQANRGVEPAPCVWSRVVSPACTCTEGLHPCLPSQQPPRLQQPMGGKRLHNTSTTLCDWRAPGVAAPPASVSQHGRRRAVAQRAPGLARGGRAAPLVSPVGTSPTVLGLLCQPLGFPALSSFVRAAG